MARWLIVASIALVINVVTRPAFADVISPKFPTSPLADQCVGKSIGAPCVAQQGTAGQCVPIYAMHTDNMVLVCLSDTDIVTGTQEGWLPSKAPEKSPNSKVKPIKREIFGFYFMAIGLALWLTIRSRKQPDLSSA